MVELETILMILQTVSLTVGVLYYIFNLRNQNRNQELALETRQAQLLMQLYARFSDREFIENSYIARRNAQDSEDIEDYRRKYSIEVNPEAHSRFLSTSRFFHSVGLLLKKGLIDVNLVGELMPATVMNTWNDVEHIIKEQRKPEFPWLWEHYEYLVQEIQKYKNSKT